CAVSIDCDRHARELSEQDAIEIAVDRIRDVLLADADACREADDAATDDLDLDDCAPICRALANLGAAAPGSAAETDALAAVREFARLRYEARLQRLTERAEEEYEDDQRENNFPRW